MADRAADVTTTLGRRVRLAEATTDGPSLLDLGNGYSLSRSIARTVGRSCSLIVIVASDMRHTPLSLGCAERRFMRWGYLGAKRGSRGISALRPALRSVEGIPGAVAMLGTKGGV